MSRIDAALANDLELEEAALQGDMEARGELRRRELQELERIEEERINNEMMWEESQFFPDTSDDSSEDIEKDRTCLICGTDSYLLFCIECMLTKTSEECDECGEKLTKSEKYSIVDSICASCTVDK